MIFYINFYFLKSLTSQQLKLRQMNTTESSSLYNHLELMSTKEILEGINNEDKKVAFEVEKELNAIINFIDECVIRMKNGGRLFYIGAGTSGRLGVVDASECPPTFGVSQDLVVGIIAGGDLAIRKAVEFAEDNIQQAWEDILKYNPTKTDTLIGIAASGNTPYVIGGLIAAKEFGMLTAGIACNKECKLKHTAQHPILVDLGPEFVTGSTRMKSGTAQKLILNMISTSLMIKLGKVKGNKMVDMQLSNAKLIDRGTRMIMQESNLNYEKAEKLLKKLGSVRAVLDSLSE
jgi:N-acetylmuramic acid 6-phosphate etherase